MYSWNCSVLACCSSWCFYPLTAHVWQSQDWTLCSTRNNLQLTYSCCAPSWECPCPVAHWNGTGDLPPPGRETETTSPRVIPDRWDQPPFSAFPVAPGFPEGRQSTAALLWHHFQRSPDDPAACRSAPGSCPSPLSPTGQVERHLAERQRAPRENPPASSMKTGKARAEVTCECSLQRWHSWQSAWQELSPYWIHTRGEGTWDIPPKPTQKLCAPRTRALALFE